MKKAFNQLNVQGKLYVVFGFITIVAIVAVCINVFNIIQLDQIVSKMISETRKTQSAYLASDMLLDLDLAETGYLLLGEEQYILQYVKTAKWFEDYFSRVNLQTEGDEEMYVLYELQDSMREHHESFYDAVNEFDVEKWDEDQAEMILESLGEELDYMDGLFLKLIEARQLVLYNTDRRTTINAFSAIGTGFFALLVVIVMAVAATSIINKQVYRPVRALTQATESFRSGSSVSHDLENYRTRSDEIGQLTRALIDMERTVCERRDVLKTQIEEMEEKLAQVQTKG